MDTYLKDMNNLDSRERKKVSVIIPVYNVEKYLTKCLDSLLNQTYKNIELIIVNDGSKDLSSQICDRYQEKDSRVMVIHKENGGAASARNVGLDLAHGEYICFVDSDDYVENNFIEKMVLMLENSDADVAVCSFRYLYLNALEHHSLDNLGCMTEKDFIKRFLSDWTCSLIWNKIFKSDIIKNIRFEEGHKIDDEFFTYKVILNANKVVIFKDELYNYRMRASSVMQTSDKYKENVLQDCFEHSTQRYLNVTQRYPDLKKIYTEHLIDYLIRLLKESQCNEECYYKMKSQIIKYKPNLKGVHINFFLKRAFKKALKAKYEPMEWTNIKDSDKVYFE